MGDKRKSPLIPEEKGIVKQFADWLDYSGYVWHYCPNKGKFQLGNDKKTPGAPDIVVIIKGLYVGVEAKVPGKKQSPEQITFQKKIEREGGKYLLISDVEELNKSLAAIDIAMTEANK